MFKMTWALVAEHADEWTGAHFGEAAMVLDEKVGAAVAGSGMNPEAQAHFRDAFLSPVREGISMEGREAVGAGREWSKAAGPLLVVLTPAA
ncbi:hypothetical protein [Streptomyces sp. NPDC090021]|uniref:hypothetical protein n=1 Tax=Streptomyces sp. NPDC090021 TaxID=3365919 RepID=UPI0038176633